MTQNLTIYRKCTYISEIGDYAKDGGEELLTKMEKFLAAKFSVIVYCKSYECLVRSPAYSSYFRFYLPPSRGARNIVSTVNISFGFLSHLVILSPVSECISSHNIASVCLRL